MYYSQIIRQYHRLPMSNDNFSKQLYNMFCGITYNIILRYFIDYA